MSDIRTAMLKVLEDEMSHKLICEMVDSLHEYEGDCTEEVVRPYILRAIAAGVAIGRMSK